ncbi:MAG: helix-turn-helix transcriptional regulator [Alistipes sp.]|jgi:plasmid maintenance system antidote protein VapI|nr:helix-turn-helix transcriptional regulator [Alistipes sp.]
MDKHITKWMPGENSIGELFNAFPELNVRQVARAMGVNETLMQQYVNGSKRPSPERRVEIERYLHNLAERLSSVKLL